MSEVLKIESLLGKTKDRIYRVGIELEGGWTKLPPGVEVQRDGSVNVQGPYRDDFESGRRVREPFQLGEIPSPPLEVTKYPAWMKAFYPSHVNETCGLHVHMSFKPHKLNGKMLGGAWYYQLLMVPEYQATIVHYLTEWAKAEKIPKSHPIWKRLSGDSQFCKFEFFPDMQVKMKNKIYDHNMPGNRYTAINYCHDMHNTIECRVLPMMEQCEMGVKAVQKVLDVTNACLVALGRKEQKLTAGVDENEMNGLSKKESRQEIISPERIVNRIF